MSSSSIVFSIAWRNVWKNKRRTILTLLTIMIGCAMIILMNAFAKGGHDQMILDAIAYNTGEIQIHEKGYWEERTIDYAFIPQSDILEALKYRNIKAWCKRIEGDGLLSYNDSTAGTFIQGVEPEREINVSNLHKSVLKGGRYLRRGDTLHAVIGETLAKNLGAKVGNRIALISQGFDGSIAANRFEIVGIFRSGNMEYDQGLTIIPIEQADSTFSMMGYIHSIAVRTGIDHIKETADYIARNTDTKDLEILSWEKLIPELVQFIVIDDASAYIFDGILFLVIAFGLLNTIQMSVFERTRELGVMLAIGTSPSRILSMILVESAMIALVGIILGALLGSAVSYYFQINPLDYSGYSDEMSVWGVNTYIYPARTTWLNLTMTSAVTLVLSIIFPIPAARRASKLKPVEAITQL